MCLSGDVRGSNNLNVAGEIQGSVEIEGRLSIEATGRIAGHADVEEAWIAGEACGDVRATTLIHVTSTGRVHGEIVAPRIIVDPGAVLKNADKEIESTGDPDVHEAPIVDVISQPPQRVDSQSVLRTRERLTRRPTRHRVVVKKRSERKK